VVDLAINAMPRLAIPSPKYFPWAVDRAAHLIRRTVPEPGEITEPLIDLTPLHLALNSYMLQPDDPQRLARVRHHLSVVQAATADASLPFACREMHEFAMILLNAEEWHPTLD
jgi:hypothetical protein